MPSGIRQTAGLDGSKTQDTAGNFKEAMMERDAVNNANSLTEETKPTGNSLLDSNRQNALAGRGPSRIDVWLAREWAILGGD